MCVLCRVQSTEYKHHHTIHGASQLGIELTLNCQILHTLFSESLLLGADISGTNVQYVLVPELGTMFFIDKYMSMYDY